jgi:hypothetical protein
MENAETYKIIDSQGNEVLADVSVSLFDFINDVDNMRQLYRLSRYTQAEQMRDKLAEKLDDVMRGFYNAR